MNDIEEGFLELEGVPNLKIKYFGSIETMESIYDTLNAWDGTESNGEWCASRFLESNIRPNIVGVMSKKSAKNTLHNYLCATVSAGQPLVVIWDGKQTNCLLMPIDLNAKQGMSDHEKEHSIKKALGYQVTQVKKKI